MAGRHGLTDAEKQVSLCPRTCFVLGGSISAVEINSMLLWSDVQINVEAFVKASRMPR